jgi:hypothetical protein
LRLFLEAALFALAFAVFVTACGWLIAGKASPMNHGITPDVRANPLLGIWVFANFPAAILFVNAFGKLGSEAQYYLCIFVQWFVLGSFPAWLLSNARAAARQL